MSPVKHIGPYISKEMNMSFVEYVLLGILGSTPIAPGTSGNVSPRTYDAESVSQPSGSAPSEAGFSAENKNPSNSNKNAASGNKNTRKPTQKSGKKSSGGTTTPP